MKKYYQIAFEYCYDDDGVGNSQYKSLFATTIRTNMLNVDFN